MRSLLQVAAIAALVVMAIHFLHIPSDAVLSVTTIASSVTIALSFALSTLLNAFVAGKVLQFERLIRPGQRIMVNGLEGTVEDPAARGVWLRGDDGSRILIPYTTLLTSPLILNPAPPAPPLPAPQKRHPRKHKKP